MYLNTFNGKYFRIKYFSKVEIFIKIQSSSRTNVKVMVQMVVNLIGRKKIAQFLHQNVIRIAQIDNGPIKSILKSICILYLGKIHWIKVFKYFVFLRFAAFVF